MKLKVLVKPHACSCKQAAEHLQGTLPCLDGAHSFGRFGERAGIGLFGIL